jgi:predicted nucleic acid-binding protein
MTFIRAQKLYGRGVGYVDVHLLAGAAIDQCQFWTLDKRLSAVATSIGIAVDPRLESRA